MSRSETGVMNNGGNRCEGGVESMHLGYGVDATSVFKAGGRDPYQVQPTTGNVNVVNIGMSGGGSDGGLIKKKRGRPRKYGPDGSMAIPLSVAVPAPTPTPTPTPAPAPAFTITHPPPPPLHQQQQQPNPPPHPHPHPPLQHHNPLPPPQPQQQQQQQQQQTPPPHPHPPPQQQQQLLHSAHQVNVTPGPAPDSPQGQPKKARGRPPGATNKKHLLETLGSPGIGFTPHVIIVKAGEDVSSRIMSFSQNGPRAICILSANGALSNVTLRQAATSGGSVTYEGRFEILSLSGSFMLSDNEGHRSRTGGLSISLAGPDGRVIGGGVAGLLIAASPVQVVVASFMTDEGREVKSGNQMEPMSKVEGGMGATGTGASSPTSRGTVSESSGGGGGGGSPINHGAGGGTVNSNPNMQHGLPWM